MLGVSLWMHPRSEEPTKVIVCECYKTGIVVIMVLCTNYKNLSAVIVFDNQKYFIVY